MEDPRSVLPFRATDVFNAFSENCSAGAFTIAALLLEDYVRIGELLER